MIILVTNLLGATVEVVNFETIGTSYKLANAVLIESIKNIYAVNIIFREVFVLLQNIT